MRRGACARKDTVPPFQGRESVIPMCPGPVCPVSASAIVTLFGVKIERISRRPPLPGRGEREGGTRDSCVRAGRSMLGSVCLLNLPCMLSLMLHAAWPMENASARRGGGVPVSTYQVY